MYTTLPGITPSSPSYSLSVTANDDAAGSVTVEPELAFYPEGTMVTVSAEAELGYFFQSYTGDVTSASAEHTFAIERNTRIVARFLPDGAEQDPELVGYATVQDDLGTPYLVTGGSLGEEVTATTLEELTMYLASAEPLSWLRSVAVRRRENLRIAHAAEGDPRREDAAHGKREFWSRAWTGKHGRPDCRAHARLRAMDRQK